jgi:uncharacterized protein (TIGR02001 family)
MNATYKHALGTLAAIAGLTTGFACSAAEEAPKFTYSFNIGLATDYVFRGVSQNKENPAVQGGIDLGYGIAYFGLWASNIDFGGNDLAFTPGSAASKQVSTEIDIYGGIKPVLGPATFDLGVIYYAYPGANDGGASKLQVEKQDYVEFKAGVSGAFIPAVPKLTLGGTVFYSPEYQAKQGNVWTVEGTAAYELPAVGPVTPTLSALIGGQFGDSNSNTIGDTFNGKFNLANGKDDLTYWNAGITLAVEKFSFDFRYWDTNISDGTTKFCTGKQLQCDERFVFLGKFTY